MTAAIAPDRARRPVLVFAVVGAAFVALVVAVMAAWVASGDFQRTAVDLSRVPSWVKAWALALTLLQVAIFAAAAWYAVRSSLRKRALSWDALLFVACGTMYWQDPLINFFRPAFYYSSTLLNRGSWVEHIPGWISPNGRLLPEPLVFIGTMYFSSIPLLGLLACFVMRKVHERRPRMSRAGVVLVAFAAMAVWDVIMEAAFIHTRLMAYPGTIHRLSLWGGTTVQFPLYECVLWGGFLTFLGALRYFRDDRGRSWVERGADEVRLPTRRRTALRALALVGCVNAGMLLYNVAMMSMTFYVDRAPAGYADHLRNGLCGDGTPYRCIGPDTPVVLPGGRPR